MSSKSRIAREPPHPQDGEVLVRFGAGGICGSDLHYYHEGGILDFKIREHCKGRKSNLRPLQFLGVNRSTQGAWRHAYACWALVVIHDHLRRKFAQFKLYAHLLDLRCLLFQACSEGFHCFPLLCVDCFLLQSSRL